MPRAPVQRRGHGRSAPASAARYQPPCPPSPPADKPAAMPLGAMCQEPSRKLTQNSQPEEFAAVRVSTRPWQRAYFDRPAPFKVGIASQESFRVLDVVGLYTDISSEMCSDRGRSSTFSHANAVADPAASFK